MRRVLAAVLSIPLVAFGLTTTLVVGATSAGAVTTDSTVFINEFHYDNTGGDVGEFIEVAGPAGTDLTGWTLVLYNGNGGAAYGTVSLSGTIADQSAAFGTVVENLPANGLQNGSPDGIALVDPANTVVQFLSYEGSFVATAGVANGLTSTDIGVSEPGTTPIGDSLQVTGSGDSADDFAWQAPAAASPGAINTGQTFTSVPAGPTAPVINELGISDASTDNEFAEIIGDPASDYAAFTLLQVEGEGTTAGVIDAVVPVGTTDANGLWTIDPGPAFENGGSTFLLVQDFGGSAGDDLDTDNDGALDVTPWTAVVDSVSIDDGGAGDLHYGTPVLDESFDDARLDNAFAPGGLSRIPDGADTDTAADWYRNDFDWDGATNGSPEPGEALNTPGTPNAIVEPPLADVVISEFHYDNDGGDVGEFVEVSGPAGTDLSGWSIVLYNGNGGAGYDTEALTGVIDDEGAGQGALSFPIAGIQNGAPDGIALVAPGDVLVEFLSYEGDFVATGGPADGVTSTDVGVAEAASTPIGQSLQLIDGTWTGPTAETPGDLNSPPNPGDCGAGTVFIHDIQGDGDTTPCNGDAVTVTGIVTTVFDRFDVPDAFFLQEEDADADADPATSEGIYVFCREACPTTAPGDQVTVTGTAAEFQGMTQINAAFGSGTFVVDSSGNPLPTPAIIDLPASGSTEAETTFEATEAMLVTFPDPLAVSEYFELARFGQVVLTESSRPYQFTHTNTPSEAGYTAFLADLATRRIILDDDNNDQNDAIFDADADEAYYQPGGGFSTTNFFRGGDTITGLTGVMHWSWAGTGDNAWRIRPIPEVYDYSFTPVNQRTTSPDDVGGRLTAVSFNVLNYFTTIDTGADLCGPAAALGCRGAHSPAEFERQEAKIVSALLEIDADIVGLVEIENNESASLQALTDALNAVAGPGTYAYVDTGTIGGDAIKVGLLYQPAAVTPVGGFAILDSSVDPTFIDTKNRPMLTQTFEEVATGARINVSVNHLKSKGSSCTDVGDPDSTDGSANCNGVRTTAAQAIVDFLASDPTGQGDPDHLILGDLNAYKRETPITTLIAGGYTDLIEQFEGNDAYSFVFDGQLGYLDYAMANAALTPQITGVDEWHINADEVSVFDYNDDTQDPGEASFERVSEALTIYAPDPYRSSDHDPVIVGIDLTVPEPSFECGTTSYTVSELEELGYNVILGTEKRDKLRGTNGPDAIFGFDGRDVILGRNGDDLLCGGSGADWIFGGAGNDIVEGDGGNDIMYGGRDDDRLDGGAGWDWAFGGRGFDTCTESELAWGCEG